MDLELPAVAHALEAKEVARRLESDPTIGLDDDEAARRAADLGFNELPAPPRAGLAARILRQLSEPMAVLLISAAVVAGVGLREVADAAAIGAIIVANTIIALVQEGRAARAIESLRTMQVPEATVRRAGSRRVVPARTLVPGDLLELAAGDRVPADARLIEASALEVDESILTGESLPVPKDPAATPSEDTPVAEQVTMTFSGTLVTRGSARALVTSTGPRTRLGAIAGHLRKPAPKTPLQVELRRLTTRLGVIAVVVALGVFALTLVRVDATTAFLSGVALAVAAVPEGLPTVVTVALALGVRRMASRGAIVRRLPAVETLGSTALILTDKTGTLTENRMRVESWSPATHPWRAIGACSDAEMERYSEVAVLCNDATLEPPTGDPMEIALLEGAGEGRVAAILSAHERIAAVPFDAERRRMSTIDADRGGERVLSVKGAPEVVLDLCATTVDGIPLGDAERRAHLARASEMAAAGARVLAMARRVLPVGERDPVAAEHDLALVGLVALRDPVRAEAPDAVREASAAGVRVVMVTGDHPGTASSVAREIGMPAGATVVTGRDLRATGIPDDPFAHAVYARVDPEDKLALVEAARARGDVVAVTGDGVNDAPALRRADIGVAMGRSGSDVAREASDMIVTDDNLATIVAAVREGRGIYDNIRKVVDYLIAGNLSEILVVVIGLLAFPALGVPLLPLQLLWINLLTDGLPAIAFGADRTDPGLMRAPPRARRAGLLDVPALGLLLGRATLIAGGALASLIVVRFAWDASWPRSRGVMFSVLVVAHLLYAFVARNPRGGRARRRPSIWLSGAVMIGLILQLAVVTVSPLQDVFGTATLEAREWALVLGLGIAPALVMAAWARARHP